MFTGCNKLENVNKNDSGCAGCTQNAPLPSHQSDFVYIFNVTLNLFNSPFIIMDTDNFVANDIKRPRKRSKVADPENWAKNVRKTLRNSGKAYVDVTG